MARVVLIMDSDTGALVDVAGNLREGGRYARFAKRMLSLDANPTLDYGANGGDSLTISRNGSPGREINLKAATVNVSGTLKVNGREVGPSGGGASLDDVVGTDGQISARNSIVEDPDTGEARQVRQISLSDSVMGSLLMISNALKDIPGLVPRDELAAVVENLYVRPEDGLDDVKETLRQLLEGLKSISGASSPQESEQEN